MEDLLYMQKPVEPSRETLIRDLCTAAEIEHSITCQYLFAAFSIKTHPEEGDVTWPQLERLSRFKTELLSVAREEMAHHGLVLNLLILIGGPPHFNRPSFPHASALTPPYRQHGLLPFGVEAMERFACYEQLHTPGTAPRSESSPPGTIGDLYQSIRDDLATVDKRMGRLFIGSTDQQVTHRDLMIGEGQYDIHLAAARDLGSAQALIDSILYHDHFDRIDALRQELEEMLARDPFFEPARPVASNPCAHLSAPTGVLVTHEISRRVARLANRSYELMTLILTRFYGRTDEIPDEIEGLMRTAFFPLMTAVTRPLGELLTQMPLTADGTDSRRAGHCFELPTGLALQPSKQGAWIFVHERLADLAKEGQVVHEAVKHCDEPWAPPLIPRFELLSENLERLALNFEQQMGLRTRYVQHMLRKTF